MAFKKKLTYFIRNIREKHRLSMRNQHSDQEVWYMHISPINILASLLALILILFIVITTTVAYTPILDMIPGYPGNKSRIMLIDNIMKLDSLEQELNNMQVYSENIALIMSGKSPVTRHDVNNPSDSIKGKSLGVPISAADSMLRQELESQGGAYSLTDPNQTRKKLRNSMELFTPTRGVVSSTFNPLKGEYGVRIATRANQQVMAAQDGTVISSSWSPNDGHMLYIQHGDNMTSIYRHNTSVLKKTGDRVRSGEVIGYTGSDQSNPADKNMFEFELWLGGTPVDPQGYILFN